MAYPEYIGIRVFGGSYNGTVGQYSVDGKDWVKGESPESTRESVSTKCCKTNQLTLENNGRVKRTRVTTNSNIRASTMGQSTTCSI